MPRPPRIHVPHGFYHVILRGNHRQPIFRSPMDRERWEEMLADALAVHQASLHGYCWMPNHVHMIVQVGQSPLGRMMHGLAGSYSRWFQYHAGTTGHLFEKRHAAIPVTTDAYLLALVRYVHQNPLRASIVDDLATYRWSSHPQYLGLRATAWLRTGRVLGMLHDDPVRARRRYRDFMAVAPVAAPEPGEVGAATPVAQTAPASPAAEPPASLDQLAESVAREHACDVASLRSPSRDRSLTRVRVAVATRAIATGIATLGEVARFLNRTPSALAQAIGRQKLK